MSVDPQGRIWIGYFDHGLDILEPGSGRAQHTENDQVFCINRIVHDRDRGLTAVATANGLVLFDAAGEQHQVLGKADGLIADHVTDVLVRPGGFVAATPAGITIFDISGAQPVRLSRVGQQPRLCHGCQRTETPDRNAGGLSVLQDGIVRAGYTSANSRLKHNWITAIVPDGSGWLVGTYGAGVLSFDASAVWGGFPELPPGMVVNPGAMLVTAHGIWAGSLGQGLWHRGATSGRWTNIVDGLPSSNVTALAVGGGYLYIGTDNGLVRAPEELSNEASDDLCAAGPAVG